MTDAEYEAIKAKIDALAEEWLEPLGLRAQWAVRRSYWRLEDEYHAHVRETDGVKPLHAEEFSSAHTHANWPYLSARICFNCPSCAHYDADQLETLFVHECAHILVHEMRAGTRCDCEYDIRHEERVCTILAQAFLWTKEYFLEQGLTLSTSSAPETQSPDV